jgi:hypothetical protein
MAVLKNTVSNGAVILPSGTTAQRPASPEQGAIRFNSQLGITEIYQWGGWVDAASGAEAPSATSAGVAQGGGAQTICYIPFYGDTATNADITDQVSGSIGTIGGTPTRNNVVGGYTGYYVSGGAYLDMLSPLVGSINNSSLPALMNGRRFWTVEFWCWDVGGAPSGTKLEMQNYPNGILWRGQGSSVDHYWRGVSISLGAMAATGAWAHMALVGYGDKIKHYQNGVEIADTMNSVGTSAFTDPFFQNTTGGSANGFRIGASSHTAATGQYTIGTFRKFRLSIGARYLSAFTPATVYPI